VRDGGECRNPDNVIKRLTFFLIMKTEDQASYSRHACSIHPSSWCFNAGTGSLLPSLFADVLTAFLATPLKLVSRSMNDVATRADMSSYMTHQSQFTQINTNYTHISQASF
jgi:hypothetical protein